MASESWSAFTLQATRSCAVEAATCLADEMSFSSLAWPCTAALAASHRLLVAAATMRACGKRGCWGGVREPQGRGGTWDGSNSFHAMSQVVGGAARSMDASSTKKCKGGAIPPLQQEPRGGFPLPLEHDLGTHGRNESLGPLSIIHCVGGDCAHLQERSGRVSLTTPCIPCHRARGLQAALGEGRTHHNPTFFSIFPYSSLTFP